MVINKNCTKYCRDSVSEIENYSLAMADDRNMWHCHHRLETDGSGMSRRELVKNGLYYKRPATELIFLSPREHQKIHNIGFKAEKLSRYRKMMTFQDFLLEKAKILKKYDFWCQRDPKNTEAYTSRMRDEIAELLDVYEAHEREYFRKVQKAAEHGGSLKRKLIPNKKGV